MRRFFSISVRYLFITSIILDSTATSTFAQRAFNKDEFVARRTKLFEKIGDGMAIVFGAKGQHYPVSYPEFV